MTSSYPTPSAWNREVSRRSFLKTSAAGVAVVGVGGGVLAACGDSDEGSDAGGFDGTIGNATGTLNIGSNASDAAPQAGLAAVVAAFPNKDVTVNINTLDHNTYQENITATLQGKEDDVLAWFAGFRNKFFADQGLLEDITDVWDAITGLGAGFKAASTASDGKQYFVPTSFYTWAVNYNPNVFAANGWTPPTDLDSTLSLADDMMSAGITPFAFANDGKWPIMGTFDILNMRLNGYDFHIDLMAGKHEWTDERVVNVFSTWETLLPYHQTGANGRTWQEAAIDMEEGRAGMYLLGTFAASALTDAANMDFFNFPELDPAIGASALDAPIDGFQCIAGPANGAAAREMLLHMSTALAQDAYLSEDPSVVASNSGANTSVYNALQIKSSELASAATGISQFLDRDTVPDIAGAAGDMFAEFIENTSARDSLLADLAEKAKTIWADQA